MSTCKVQELNRDNRDALKCVLGATIEERVRTCLPLTFPGKRREGCIKAPLRSWGE